MAVLRILFTRLRTEEKLLKEAAEHRIRRRAVLLAGRRRARALRLAQPERGGRADARDPGHTRRELVARHGRLRQQADDLVRARAGGRAAAEVSRRLHAGGRARRGRASRLSRGLQARLRELGPSAREAQRQGERRGRLRAQGDARRDSQHLLHSGVRRQGQLRRARLRRRRRAALRHRAHEPACRSTTRSPSCFARCTAR